MIDIKEILELYGNLSLDTVAKCFTVYILINIIRTIRFVLLFEENIRIRDTLPIVLIHGFYNRILPFRIGEGFFPLYMKAREDVEVSDSLMSLVIVRLFDLTSTVFIFVCTYLITLKDIRIVYQLMIVILLFVLSVAMLPVILYIIEKVLLKFTKLNKYKIFTKLKDIINYKRHKLQMKNNITLFLLSVMNWILMFLIFKLLLIDFNIILPFKDILLSGSFSNLSSILPISSLGNFGTMEIGWSAVLVNIGYGSKDAMLSGFSVNLFTFTCIFVLGLIGFGFIKIKDLHKGGDGK
jgi:uncharacterized protein (TIRG00374 family)